MKSEGGKAQAQWIGDCVNLGVMRLEFGGGLVQVTQHAAREFKLSGGFERYGGVLALEADR